MQLPLQKLVKFISNVLFSTNPERPGDLKESFDVGAVNDENFVSSFFILIFTILTACAYNVMWFEQFMLLKVNIA